MNKLLLVISLVFSLTHSFANAAGEFVAECSPLTLNIDHGEVISVSSTGVVPIEYYIHSSSVKNDVVKVIVTELKKDMACAGSCDSVTISLQLDIKDSLLKTYTEVSSFSMVTGLVDKRFSLANYSCQLR